MMRARSSLGAGLLCGVAAVALGASAARAETAEGISISPQPLSSALGDFAAKTHRAILVTPDLTARKVTAGVAGAADAESALTQVLAGTGLTYKHDGATFLIVKEDQDTGNVVQELVVTAQKKEEAIQTVPIAISAFTQKSLEEQHIEGGFDLLKAIPNVTFSKNNFTSYNFSIRGIGTKAISATTDPGVAVAFNNTALIQNRLFEQEYFDVERVEVLRGPQGTLYGRNATAGVINVISAKPSDHFEGSVKAEVGNYQSRRASGMINIPIFGDQLAVRLAGSFTQRDGYDYNSVTHNPVNGRNLWSGRLTVGFRPSERLHGNFIWEHFDENDNRSRTGKQLCHRDPGPNHMGSVTFPTPEQYPYGGVLEPALFSQGCKPGSLYDDGAFGTPNGLALPFVFGALGLSYDCRHPGQNDCTSFFPLGYAANGGSRTFIDLKDPYGGMMQSRDLRVIASYKNPKYRAKADVAELNFDVDLTPALVFTSQTAYDQDQVYSFQDFNRFNTVPIFTDTTQLADNPGDAPGTSRWANLIPGGVYCDPQLGCSNTLAGFDISQAKSTQFSQEFRLQSSFSGPINFSAGANYTHFKTLIDYYVMYNLITAFAQSGAFGQQQTDITKCSSFIGQIFNDEPPVAITDPRAICPYIDPNPVDSINGEGHNYFRSKNPYKLNSWAAFGEVYWQATENLKITGGLRYTDDRKDFTPVPSQILLGLSILGGTVNRGYPALPDIKQQWGEFTGRFGADWTPSLSFTDRSMLYAFYSRGYKGGGANPPGIGFSTKTIAAQNGFPPGSLPNFDVPFLRLTAMDYGPTFKPEFVNAFEVGAKNTLLGGSLVLNADAFFYDYKDYQVSKIVDRTAVNENFDARVWGAELESVWQPARNLRINANFGYLGTRIGAGAKSIDLMNRTQSNPDWVVIKPWIQLPSNCIIPVTVAENYVRNAQGNGRWYMLCGGFGALPFNPADPEVVDPKTGLNYTPDTYPQINGGAGFDANLEGDELPNSPHWTTNLGVQQSWDFLEGWKATLRGDAYWQSQSWARVYNDDPYDKLHGWYNVNLSLWFEKPDTGLKIEIYAKNLLDKTPITDAFLNSDDTALTTNVFVLDPRLVGFSITKTF